MDQNPHDNPSDEVEELRVEHVLAALDQMAELSAQVRAALNHLPREMVLAKKGVGHPDVGWQVYALGKCMPRVAKTPT
jgi:hypothetical protein